MLIVVSCRKDLTVSHAGKDLKESVVKSLKHYLNDIHTCQRLHVEQSARALLQSLPAAATY
jgi:hypothetical protein